MIISHQSAVGFWRLFRSQLLPRNGLSRWLEDELYGVRLLHSGTLWSDQYLEHISRTPALDAKIALPTHVIAEWESRATRERRIGEDVPFVFAADKPNTRQSLDNLVSSHLILSTLPSPLHVLVSSAEKRRNKASVKEHVATGALPPGSLYQVGPQLFVCSPELTFIQMAQVLSRPKLVRLGDELCGGYALAPHSTRGFTDCYPVTSPELIANAIASASWIRGLRNAEIASRRILARCASPAETDATIVLFFPRREGGSGFKPVQVNAWIPNEGGIPNNQGEKGYWCDIAYEKERTIIELDGREGHSDDAARIHDSSKHRNLTADGYRVVVIVNSQLRSLNAMNSIAADIEKLLGLRRRPAPIDYAAKRCNLFRELFG